MIFTPSSHAKALSRSGKLKHRQLVRDKCNEIRRDMGEKPINFWWLRLRARLGRAW